MRWGVAVLAAGLVLPLTGCEESEYVGPARVTVRASLTELYAGDDPSAAEVAEGDCFARALLDRRGPVRLAEIGLVDDDGLVSEVPPILTRSDAGAWVSAQAECTTYGAVAARAAGLSGSGVVADFTGCLNDAVPLDDQRTALVDTLSGSYGSPDSAALAAAERRCRRAVITGDGLSTGERSGAARTGDRG